MSVQALTAAVEDVLLKRNGSMLSTADREALSRALDALAPKAEWARYVQEQIEERWLDRAKAQGYTKTHTVKYREAELNFFVGAMTAINAILPHQQVDSLSPHVPTRWVINPMSGRNICG